jgi:hypothetical protein
MECFGTSDFDNIIRDKIIGLHCIIRVRGNVLVQGQKHKVTYHQIYLFYVHCIRKVTVLLQNVLEVMPTSIYTVSKH